jgi:hypothetical protein
VAGSILRTDPTPLPGIRLWYRDPISCLHSTLATLLMHAGAEPLPVLGLAWDFRYLPGDVRTEEFYWAGRYPGDLAHSVLPYHDVTSRWRVADPDEPLADLAAVLVDGRLPVVAADNFHLPFRPAYQDVHSAHLIVIAEVDPAGGRVRVSDAMPPAYQGWLDLADLRRAWGSGNPRDYQNVFFGGDPIGGRWLDIRLGGPFPELTGERLAIALAANVRGFAAPDGPGWAGLDGLRGYTAELLTRAGDGDGAALEEAYTFGWGPQAQAALHGELLRRCGDRWRRPGLVDAGRLVERTAHLWTGVRVTAAHGRDDPRRAAESLARHVERLHRAYEDALAAIDQTTV